MADAASRAATRRKTRSTTAKAPAHRNGPTEDEIRQRAYEIYVARGEAPGDARWDWQQAELELRARIALLGRV